MSFSSDLDAVFGETETTRPVCLVRTGSVARGFLDDGVEIATQDVSVAGVSKVLHLKKDALAGAVMDDQIRIGAEGASNPSPRDPLYEIRGPVAIKDDGAFDHFAVVEV